MMSVYEYASDVNLSVDVILKLCEKLGINVNNEEDMLDDDAIIMLDNEVANIDKEELTEEIEEQEIEEELEEELESNIESKYEEIKKEVKNNKNINNKKNQNKNNNSKKNKTKADFE